MTESKITWTVTCQNGEVTRILCYGKNGLKSIRDVCRFTSSAAKDSYVERIKATTSEDKEEQGKLIVLGRRVWYQTSDKMTDVFRQMSEDDVFDLFLQQDIPDWANAK